MVHGDRMKLGYPVNVILNADAVAVIQVENSKSTQWF